MAAMRPQRACWRCGRCGGGAAGFRVSVDLRRYYAADDPRARRLLWVPAARASPLLPRLRPRTVRWLHARVRRALPPHARSAPLCIATGDRLLPADEPLAILRPADELQVIPLENEWPKEESRKYESSMSEEESGADSSAAAVAPSTHWHVLAPTEATPTALAPTEATPTALAPTEATPTALAPTEATPTALAPTEATPTALAPTEATPSALAPTQAGELQQLKERALALLQQRTAAGPTPPPARRPRRRVRRRARRSPAALRPDRSNAPELALPAPPPAPGATPPPAPVLRNERAACAPAPRLVRALT